jgi:hypothetical protein
MLRLGVRNFIASAACALAAAATMSASADGPTVTLGVNVNGNSVANQGLNGSGTNLSDVFNYQGNLLSEDGGWLLSWNFNASNQSNGGLQAFTAGNYVIQNLSAEAITFELTVSLPTALLGSTVYGGSVSGGLTTTGPGGISSNGQFPVWSGSTGGLGVASLFNSPFSVLRTEAGSSSLGFESFGNPIPSLPGPDLGSDLSIKLSFVLEANSSASFTSVFVARVPAPGAVALMGLAGLAGLGRRRRA